MGIDLKIGSINCIIINNIRGEGEGNMVEKNNGQNCSFSKIQRIVYGV